MSLRFRNAVRRVHLSVAAFVLGVGITPSFATDDGAVRISLSIRQASLIETITASACFAMGGLDTQRQEGVALEGLDRYETVLNAFREGHEFLYLSPLPDTADAGTLMWAQDTWDAFAPSLQQIIAGDLHTVVMRRVINDREETVLTAIALASEFTNAFGEDVLTMETLPAVRLVGHLQMLTQQAVRQSCFLHFGLGGADLSTALQATLAEVDATFERLGPDGDMAGSLPNARIARNIRTAGTLWRRVTPALLSILDAQATEPSEIAKMLKMNGGVLKQLNQAIDGFVQ